MSEELKPCPFCGCNIYPEVRGMELWDIDCDSCGYTISAGSPNGRLKKWNTRPIEDALRTENEQLKAEIDTYKKLERERWESAKRVFGDKVQKGDNNG